MVEYLKTAPQCVFHSSSAPFPKADDRVPAPEECLASTLHITGDLSGAQYTIGGADEDGLRG
jgi:hypothetical protein